MSEIKFCFDKDKDCNELLGPCLVTDDMKVLVGKAGGYKINEHPTIRRVQKATLVGTARKAKMKNFH